MKRQCLLINVAVVLLLALSTSAAPGCQVTIIRDNYGVPHVFASTPESLWYGAGYAQAQDRLWQADLSRRFAKGTLAEILGPDEVPASGDRKVVKGDVRSRLLYGSDQQRVELLATASAEAQLIFESFAAGINAWIEEATTTGQLPAEYYLYGLSPAPWEPEDSIAVLQIFLRLAETGWREPDNAAHLEDLITRFGPDEGMNVFLDTHWLNDPDARATITGEATPNPPPPPPPILPDGLVPCWEEQRAAEQAWEGNMARVGLRRGPDSNAVVIGPDLSADGCPLLLGGPQLGYTTPQRTLEMGLHQCNFHVTGMGIAGLPAILVGVTRTFAWTWTGGVTDNVDTYYEVLNPGDPGQYEFDDEYLDFDCREETFKVRGADDEIHQLCESIHGPVIAHCADAGLALTLKAAVRGLEMQTYEAILDLLRARTPAEVGGHLANVAVNLNFFYADVRGNIAYWHTGKIPVRAEGDNPWLPHDGTGAAEWKDFIDWEEMPHTLNPDQGWIANWNNKPAPSWNNAVFGYANWGPTQLVDALFELLEGRAPGTVTLETVKEINRKAGLTTDTPSSSAVSVFVPALLDKLLAHVDTGADDKLPEVHDLLAAWDWLQTDEDKNGYYDSPAVAIFNTWYLIFVDRVFADDLGIVGEPIVNPPPLPETDIALSGNLTYRLLDDNPALPLLHDYLEGETAEQAVTASLIEALDDLKDEYGSADSAAWLQPVAEIFWQPLPGVDPESAPNTPWVPHTLWMNRGTYNQIVHLGKGPDLYSVNVVAPGQSGDPLSPHFADQEGLYATWDYKDMRLKRANLNGRIESITRLTPPR